MDTELITEALPKTQPAQFKGLLTQLWNKTISLNEGLKECAYFALQHGFNEIRPHPLPTMPDELKEYYHQRQSNKNLKLSNAFWNQPKIEYYLDKKQEIINLNRSNLFWLKEIRRYIPEWDKTSIQKIDDRIMEFEIKAHEKREDKERW